MDNKEHGSKQNTYTPYHQISYTQEWIFAAQPRGRCQYYIFGPIELCNRVSWKEEKHTHTSRTDEMGIWW